MKRVLITNLYFVRYTGSELHVLEVTKLFEKRGSIHVIDVLSEELGKRHL